MRYPGGCFRSSNFGQTWRAPIPNVRPSQQPQSTLDESRWIDTTGDEEEVIPNPSEGLGSQIHALFQDR